MGGSHAVSLASLLLLFLFQAMAIHREPTTCEAQCSPFTYTDNLSTHVISFSGAVNVS